MSNDGDGFEERTVRLDVGEVAYREAGSGPPVLFVHGWGVNGELWTGTAARLAAAGHRCIVPDLPFGSHRIPLAPDADLSPPGAARIVADFIAALELNDLTLVGNDSGGAICQLVVTRHPARIGRLVLTNADCLEIFPPGTFKLMSRALRVPGVMTLIANGLRLRAMQRSPLAFGALTTKPIPDATLDSWVRPPIEDGAIRRDSRKFGAGMDAKYTLEAAELLPSLEIPAKLVWGTADPFFTIEHARRLAELIPGCELVEVEGGRTFLPLDEPDRVATEIATFSATRAKAVPMA